jgi:hypothetical protein
MLPKNIFRKLPLEYYEFIYVSKGSIFREGGRGMSTCLLNNPNKFRITMISIKFIGINIQS